MERLGYLSRTKWIVSARLSGLFRMKILSSFRLRHQTAGDLCYLFNALLTVLCAGPGTIESQAVTILTGGGKQ
ncbi:MAG: hypothetical protein XXXJIFNMEKO3_03493 [Candidatus Erwinia impunctatus]|nr:hypothetical protein XXXJIFNMEKO_03493 [Culicoides impunctatus]